MAPRALTPIKHTSRNVNDARADVGTRVPLARKQGGEWTAPPERRPGADRLRQPIGDDPKRRGVEAEPEMGAPHFHVFALKAFRLLARPPGDDAVRAAI